ncbi:MAG: hypothetical protein OEW12_04275 [Deltaproteobacteria bacterium]|nr:hypothetical protein [Deltaproteobacteria bacterium]
MNSLAESWFVWLILTGVIIGLLIFIREGRHKSSEQDLFSTEKEFSLTNLLFGLKKGEGDIFMGYSLAIVFFSMFLAGLVRWVRQFFF